MKFVFAKSHPSISPDWWLIIDSESSAEVEKRSFKSTIKHHLEPLIFHDLKSGPKNNAAVIALEVCSKVMAKHTMLLISGSRQGWYANRFGGNCPNMHKIFKTVESDTWPATKSNEELFNTAKFSKWSGGKHWYVRLVDGTNVEVDGQAKWNTKEAAIRATKKFLDLPV